MWRLIGCTQGEIRVEPSDLAGVVELQFEPRRRAQVRATATFDGQTTTTPWISAEAGVVPVTGLIVGETATFGLEFDRGGAPDPVKLELPGPPPGAPELRASDDAGCDPDGYVLFSYVSDDASGVAIADREGRYRWIAPTTDPGMVVARARLARDGDSVLWNVVSRERDPLVDGSIVRRGLDGALPVRTPAYRAHDDFVELEDGRVTWLSFELSQPANGATLQLQATDAVFALEQGEQVRGRPADGELFSTLGDYTPGVYALPDEGIGGASIPGCDEFGRAASLSVRDSDGALFLMWRWVDTLLKIDPATSEVGWEWGGPYDQLGAEDPFEHAHLGDVWDGGALVFDNRAGGHSWVREYTFDDSHAEQVWAWEAQHHEDGPGDVRRIDGCDHLLVTWPTTSVVEERTRDGEVAWLLAADGASIARAQPIEPW